ncbi:MAG: hypothetical protein FJ102_08245 [Deltaproteobacteria bacterium]|nr:hypothetical protein [Deltaproteobacteria bacterium]
MILDRRQLLGLGCLAAAVAVPRQAEAVLPGPPPAAPRWSCPHALCRHFRAAPGGGGFCAFSLRSQPLPEEP